MDTIEQQLQTTKIEKNKTIVRNDRNFIRHLNALVKEASPDGDIILEKGAIGIIFVLMEVWMRQQMTVANRVRRIKGSEKLSAKHLQIATLTFELLSSCPSLTDERVNTGEAEVPVPVVKSTRSVKIGADTQLKMQMQLYNSLQKQKEILMENNRERHKERVEKYMRETKKKIEEKMESTFQILESLQLS